MTMTKPDTDTRETRLVITIDHDQYAESPAAWDEPLELHMPEQWQAKWYASGQLVAGRCADCGDAYPSEHPNSEGEHDEDDEGNLTEHEWVADPDVVAYVLVDSRGPYTTIHEVTEAEIREQRYGWEYSSADVWLGALVHGSAWDDQYWGTEEKVRELVDAIIAEWEQWFSGDVYWVRYERVAVCACCGQDETVEEESCGGIYGSDYMRDFLSGDFGLTAEEIAGAEVFVREVARMATEEEDESGYTYEEMAATLNALIGQAREIQDETTREETRR